LLVIFAFQERKKTKRQKIIAKYIILFFLSKQKHYLNAKKLHFVNKKKKFYFQGYEKYITFATSFF